ncbi:MAG: heme exporter protein CcmD [Zoogloeaceae bacterium]|jgi:heme exporter protein D|nr:heme exporter protein CcmD [Zoogloeaceae bacterium]
MYWNSLSDFLAMGGYGLYVWGSFGMTALVMLLEPWLALRRQRAIRLLLARQLLAAMQEEEKQKKSMGAEPEETA